MRAMFAFFVCTIATWTMFHYVFDVNTSTEQGQFFTILISIVGGLIGSLCDHHMPVGSRVFDALADLFSACAERMRKG